MKRRILPIILTTLALGAAPKATPSAPPPGGGAGFSFSDWHVTTGQLDANWQSGNFNTPGRIVLTRPGSDIQADRANGNFKQHQATLTGHVVLHDNNGVLTNFAGQTGSKVPATLTCDNLNIDGTSKTYVATGSVYFKQGASEVRSDRAVMNGMTHDIHLYGHVQLTQ
jgi:lipopolysaccharide assembly outer membrane protein LptD (OstA)